MGSSVRSSWSGAVQCFTGVCDAHTKSVQLAVRFTEVYLDSVAFFVLNQQNFTCCIFDTMFVTAVTFVLYHTENPGSFSFSVVTI